MWHQLPLSVKLPILWVTLKSVKTPPSCTMWSLAIIALLPLAAWCLKACGFPTTRLSLVFPERLKEQFPRNKASGWSRHPRCMRNCSGGIRTQGCSPGAWRKGCSSGPAICIGIDYLVLLYFFKLDFTYDQCKAIWITTKTMNINAVHSCSATKKCLTETRKLPRASYPLGNTYPLSKPVTLRMINSIKDTTLTIQSLEAFLLAIISAYLSIQDRAGTPVEFLPS